MTLFAAFFRLIRWLNLVFIALTQILFYYFVVPFVYRSEYLREAEGFPPALFYLLLAASVCIAAAGYIINDYFDLNIDIINKPSAIIIEKYIKRRWAIVLHIILSLTGLLLSVYVGYKIKNVYIPFFNLLAIASLWVYSTTLKKQLLIGNVIISLLTAWVILVLALAEYKALVLLLPAGNFVNARLIKFSFLYAGFAFVISLIREVIKDIEDINGDLRYGCRTMPIVWGVPASKVFAGVWIVVLTGVVCIIQFYVIQLGWWFSAIYSTALIMIPLVYILRKLYDAQTQAHYHRLSTLVKFVMFTGILSMLLFKMYL